MQDRSSGLMVTVAIAAASVSAAISVPVTKTSAQAPTASGPTLKTPWGEPDLQGIWTDEFDTPLQRPAKYANQEYFTEAQRDELQVAVGAVGFEFGVIAAAIPEGARDGLAVHIDPFG